jgi:hypothetical protein
MLVVAERYHFDIVDTHRISPLPSRIIHDDALVFTLRSSKDYILTRQVIGIESAISDLLRP